nr:uncharacterized protein LOC108064316 isoform X3 [Drosophila takahashii]
MTPRPRREQVQANERKCTRGIHSYRCRVCRGVHPLKKCVRFLRLTMEKRLRAVLINGYCANCLAHEHSGEFCRSGNKCRQCDGAHHTLLHMRKLPRSRSRSPYTGSRSPRHTRSPTSVTQSPFQPGTGVSSSSLTALLQHRSPRVFPTASILVHNGATQFDTRALIDPCEPVSRINASMAQAFHLEKISVGSEEVCSAVIKSIMTPEFRLEVYLKIDPHLSHRTPSTPIDLRIRQKFKHLTLADERFDRPSTVAIVLGADVYSDVICAGVLPSTDGLPVAQNPVFGWTLSGACRC